MAFAHDIRSFEAGLIDRVRASLREARERRAQYRRFRQTYNELSKLSSRELADLGLHRSQLTSVALEAAREG